MYTSADLLRRLESDQDDTTSPDSHKSRRRLRLGPDFTSTRRRIRILEIRLTDGSNQMSGFTLANGSLAAVTNLGPE